MINWQEIARFCGFRSYRQMLKSLKRDHIIADPESSLTLDGKTIIDHSECFEGRWFRRFSVKDRNGQVKHYTVSSDRSVNGPFRVIHEIDGEKWRLVGKGYGDNAREAFLDWLLMGREV